jgi:CBS domain-containing protein
VSTTIPLKTNNDTGRINMFDFDVRAGQDASTPELLVNLSRARGLRDDFSDPVSRVPRRAALLLSPSCSLREATNLMAIRHAGTAVVVSHGVLLGMLGEREVVRRMLEQKDTTEDLPVWKVMASDPETLLETDSVAYAIRKLWMLGGRAMPIVRPNGTLLGLLETQDVVTWLCDRLDAATVAAEGHGAVGSRS